jgi:nicotinamidase-related amidase
MTKPIRRALVVIDVQNEYFAGGGLPIEHPPIDETLPNVTRAMDAARAAGCSRPTPTLASCTRRSRGGRTTT